MMDELDIDQLIEEIQSENERIVAEWKNEIQNQLNQYRRVLYV